MSGSRRSRGLGTAPRTRRTGPGHADARGLLTEAREGGLRPTEQRALRAHLSACSPCSAFAATFEGTIALVRQLPRAAMPADARSRLLERMATVSTGSAARR